MQPYKVLVSIAFLRLQGLSRTDRDRILKFIEALADNPWKVGDYEERDDVGHPVQIKIIGDYALTSWADHAVKEIKVIRVETADRAR